MDDNALSIKIYKMLLEWRKTKSLALAYDICKTLLTHDGALREEDINYVEYKLKETQ